MRKLDQVRRSPCEDIYLLLREVYGAPHVELRLYHLPVRPGADPLPGLERIAIPVDVLPDLLRVLAQALVRLVQDGLVDGASLSELVTMEAGEPVALRGGGRGDSRREPRVPLRLRVGCRILDAADSLSSKAVTGETKDVSRGGLQVWLPEHLSLFSRVEVYMRIGGLTFQGRAEVVGAEVHPTHEGYRHRLRWLDLTPKAKVVLSQAISPS